MDKELQKSTTIESTVTKMLECVHYGNIYGNNIRNVSRNISNDNTRNIDSNVSGVIDGNDSNSITLFLLQHVATYCNMYDKCNIISFKGVNYMDSLMKTKELCEYLKLSRMTIERYRKEGMPFKKYGRNVRFEINKVIEWLEDRKGDYNGESNSNC